MTKHLWHLSVIVYALSWCVPVLESSGELFRGTYWGWQAALFAISPLLGNDLDANWFVRIMMAVSALTNVFYLGAMAHAYVRPAARRRGLAWAMVGASIVNVSWPLLFDLSAELRLGYYLWVTAFPLSAASLLRQRAPNAPPLRGS
jgi:hypothetical protein